MEIHPPHAIHSVKDFLLQLLTITVGILIALTLEGLLEWTHHRTLVHEAEANLITEIHENRADIGKALEKLHASEEQLNQMVALVHRLQENRTTPVGDVTFNWTLADLHATSWNTANATGAVANMDYPEVKRYTRVYDLQQQFMTIQNRAIDSIVAVYGQTTLLQRDMKKVSDAELAEAEHVLGLAQANARAIESIGNILNDEYAKVN